ncbi:MAG TPA: hypothetical protein VFU21_06270, partial [Kofleriaceae bacterium]|nr:hypothetical protein [Kofleriaceae bacterium]
MHFTSTCVCSAIALAVLSSPAIAEADQSDKGKKEIQAKNKKAMESFDMLEFEAARSALTDALSLARKHKLEKDKVVARVYLNLGIVEFAGLKDEDAARTAFASAVAIDPDIQIDVAYKTEGMAELLSAVKKGGGKAGGGERGGSDLFADGEGEGGGAGCDAIDGIDHSLVEAGKPGVAQTISARVGTGVGAEKVTLYYRAQGAVDFTAIPMKKGKGCTFEAEIPSSAMKGEAVHYYVAALKGKKSLASRGSSGSPNIIELAGSAGAADPDENPLGGGSSGGDISGGVEAGGEDGGKKTVFVSLAVGTGGGYVTGTTEVAGSEVGCCFAPALLHLLPEIGYYFSRQLSLSAAFRMGFAMGANVMGHATAAPAGFLRLRYALAESGDGLQVSGALGGGIIRHTVKVEEAPSGMDTDTTASGPVLVGGGLGYVKPISGSMRFVGEVNTLAAIPAGIKELGTCPGSGCVKPH